MEQAIPKAEYGVCVTNKFDFLDDDGTDPEVLLARVMKEKKAKAKLAKTEAKKEPVPPPQPAKPAAPKEVKENNENRQPGNRPNNRGPRGPPRQNKDGEMTEKPRRELRSHDNRGPRRDDGVNKPRRHYDNNNPEEGGEDHPPRRYPPRRDGERGERPRGPRGPRPDRVSGSDKTGVRSVPKKDGHGKGNWGNEKDELVGETEPNAQPEEPKVEGEQVAEQETPVEKPDEEEVPEEKEVPKLTLEEWKQQQKQDKPVFKTRKANEGADQKALQKFVPLKKKDDEEEETEEYETEIVQTKRKQMNKPVDIQVNFNDPNRSSRPNRPRDNREGGTYRGRGDQQRDGNNRGPRGPRQNPSTRGAPHFNAHDFPALGAVH